MSWPTWRPFSPIRASGIRSEGRAMLRRIPIGALIGLILTVLFFLVAIFAQWLAPYGLGDIAGGVWEPMSAKFPLGTDNIGRDLLSRMIYGAQTTILIAVLATLLSFSMGAIL